MLFCVCSIAIFVCKYFQMYTFQYNKLIQISAKILFYTNFLHTSFELIVIGAFQKFKNVWQ
jgi:hypothetical protein